MKQCESYAHKYAKETVAQWFKEKWLINRDKGYRNSYFIFDWNPDNNDGDHGIKLEYPILIRKLQHGEEEVLGVATAWKQYPKEPLADNIRIEAVLDIAVCSNDKLLYGFEIVHKHKCTIKKLSFLKKLKQDYGVTVYEINASWVLDQIHRPATLVMTEVSS